jgi:putative ABC transport system permease protein
MDGDPRASKRIALASDPARYRQIIGVVADVHQLGIEKDTIPEVFLPIYQVEDLWLAIVARTNGNPMQYVAAVRKAVQSVDPRIAVFLPRTMEQIISEQRGWRKFETTLVSSFAAIALLLAAIGSYALVSYAVTQRFAEIGIRIALGATDKNILKSFTLQGSVPAILGTCLGILLGFWAGRLSARLLYGIGPYDTLSYCGAAVLIIFVAAAASYLPARRAASLDPSRALRYE